MEQLVKIGVLARQPESYWGSPALIIPKADQTVRLLTDFRKVNKDTVRTPFPILKISSTLQETKEFTFTTNIYLNMWYYTIRLDPEAQKICTIILPWSRYLYLRLPMGISGASDIFQEKMLELMRSLEYVRTYTGDLLVIIMGMCDNYLDKVDVVLDCLRLATLFVYVKKSHFALREIKYLGYVLSHDGIKPQSEKVSATLALRETHNLKILGRILGMVQYY